MNREYVYWFVVLFSKQLLGAEYQCRFGVEVCFFYWVTWCNVNRENVYWFVALFSQQLLGAEDQCGFSGKLCLLLEAIDLRMLCFCFCFCSYTVGSFWFSIGLCL